MAVKSKQVVAPRDKPIFVRLTVNEHRKIARAARTKGLGISAYVRMVLLSALATEAYEQDLPGAGAKFR